MIANSTQPSTCLYIMRRFRVVYEQKRLFEFTVMGEQPSSAKERDFKAVNMTSYVVVHKTTI